MNIRHSSIWTMLCLSIATVLIAENPEKIVVKASRLIDGKSDKPLRDAVVIIENERIVQVGSGISIPPNAGFRAIQRTSARVVTFSG